MAAVASWRNLIQTNGEQLIKQAQSLPQESSLYAHLRPEQSSIYYEAKPQDPSLQQRIKTILDATHQTLHLYLKTLEQSHLPKYRSYLNALYEGAFYPEESILVEREELYLGFKAIGPLLSKSLHLERLQRIFHSHFCISCFDLFEELKCHHNLIALQGFLGEQIPLKDLLEHSLKQIHDAEFLMRFAAKLGNVPLKTIHNGLKAVVDYWIACSPPESESPDLGHLENILEEAWQNSPFIMPEPKYLRWRDRQSPGSILSSRVRYLVGAQLKVEWHTFVLGQQIGDPHPQDNNKFFTIQQYTVSKTSKETLQDRFGKGPPVEQRSTERLLLWFNANKALLGMKKDLALRQAAHVVSHCLPLNCPSFLDPKGRFACVEWLHTKLAGPEWPLRLPRYLPPVIAWMCWLQENSITPANFQTDYILYNLHNRLTAVKAMPPLSYDPLAMEKFAWQLSMGDVIRFKSICEGASLGTHPAALYIRKIVHQALGSTIDDAPFKPTPAIEHLALTRSEKMKKVRDECLKTYGKPCRNMETCILYYYKESGGTALILSQWIQEKILGNKI